MQVLFFKCLSSLGVFLTFLLVQINYLVSLANVKEFLMDICLLNVNINVSINDNLFKYIWVVYYLKLIFYCLTCSAMPNLNSANFTTQNSQSSEEILILKRETLPEFQNKTNIKIIGFKLMHLGFALSFVRYRFEK